MQIPSSPLSEPESEHMLPPGAHNLGVLRDAHGAQILQQYYYLPDQTIYAQWFGNLTADAAIAGAKAMLPPMQKLHLPLVLCDKSMSTGDWTDALPWLEYEWLPLVHQYGVRAFAYVFSPDMHNQLSALAFCARTNMHLPVQMFYDADLAREWLMEQR